MQLTRTALVVLMLWAIPARAQWDTPVLMGSGTAESDLGASGDILHYVYSTDWTSGPIRYRRSLNEGSTWETERTLASNGTLHFTDSVATSGSDLYVLYFGDMRSFNFTWGTDQVGNLYLLHSGDSGLNWDAVCQLTTDDDVYRASIVALGADVHVVWSGETTGHIYHRGSASHGLCGSWSSRTDFGGVQAERPQVVAYGSFVHVIWEDARAGRPACYTLPSCPNVYYIRSINRGASFEAVQQLVDFADRASIGRPEIAVVPSTGTVVAIYQDIVAGDQEIFTKSSTGSGAAGTWAAPVRLTSLSGTDNHPTAGSMGGLAAVAWNNNFDTGGTYFSMSADGGASWIGPEVVSGTTGASPNKTAATTRFAHVAYQEGGNAYLRRRATGTPFITVSPTTVTAGGTVTVSWSGVTGATVRDWFGTYVPSSADTSYLSWSYDSSCTTNPGSTAKTSGSCTFTMPLTAGNYEFRLFSNNSYSRLATSGSVAVGGGGTPSVTVSPTTVAAGGTVTASWNGIVNPTATDWIGLYAPGAANTAYIDWIYVSCSKSPSSARASGSCPFTVPASVAPGNYELRLFPNSMYTVLATSNPLNVGTSTAGSLQFSLATYSVAENGGNATITITRTGGSAGAVSVMFATSNGTAMAGSDYTATTQTVNFGNGDTANKTVSIPILDDTLVEGNETVNLTLSSPTGGATLGNPSTATLTITDNDGAPTLTVSPATVLVGGTVTATWSGIVSPTATDWIGLYAPGAANTAYIDWIYVSCSKTPGSARPSGSCGLTVPTTVTPGTYQLRLLANDGFVLLATSNSFTVQ